MSIIIRKFRNEIDEIDRCILNFLSERFEVSDKIGAIKKHNHTDVEDKNREKIVRAKWAKFTKGSRMDFSMTEKILNIILEESKKRQE